MLDTTINEKLWDFLLSGGVFMAFIATCSFVAIAVSIHRALTLRWSAVIPDVLGHELARCGEYFKQRKTSLLYLALKRSESPVGRIGSVALSSEFQSREAAADAVEATAKEQMVKLENGMGVLEVVITIAPLLGLLGTVSGLVSVFATLGTQSDVSDPTLIAAGIAVALNTTIAGLVVAVITVIFHSYFTRRLERVAARLEVIAGGLVHEFYKQGGPVLYQSEPKEDRPDEAVARAIKQSSEQVENSDTTP
ncbi:MAG: MotA/TolQ/ExbB proton channel family protein [Verrucomicrobiales bacterium]